MLASTSPSAHPLDPRDLGSVVRSLSFAPTPAPPPNKTNQSAITVAPDEPPEPESGAIRVVLRVRPLRECEKNQPTCIVPSKRGTGLFRIRPTVPNNHARSIKNAGYAAYRFEHVFDEHADQERIFETTALPLVQSLFQGDNAVVFAYGVTCSGKTWTIQGDNQHPGILPRALDVIVNSIAMAKGQGLMQDSQLSEDVALLTERDAKRRRRRGRPRPPVQPRKVHDSNYIPVDPNVDYQIFASYIEVYQERCYDLFESNTTSIDDSYNEVKQESFPYSTASNVSRIATKRQKSKRTVLKLKTNTNGEVYADGQSEVQIHSRADICRLLEFGQHNRTMARTNANEHSSRSHAIFIITLKQSTKNESLQRATRATVSRFHIVDLAGSERTSRTNNDAARVQEAKSINTSLMNLGRCLRVLRANQKLAKEGSTREPGQVPFRCSSLTRLLKDSLTSGRAVMIVNVSPVLRDADETIHALGSGYIAKQVQTKPRPKRTVLTDRTNLIHKRPRALGKPPQKPETSVNRTKLQPELSTSKRSTGKRGRTTPSSTERGQTLSSQRKDFIALKKEHDALQKLYDESAKEIRILRMELEECLLEREAEQKEADSEIDGLFKENTKLKECLIDAEANFRLAERDIREEVANEAESIIKELQEQYEKQLREQEHQNREMSAALRANEDRKRAEQVAKRLARASIAAFEGVTLNFPSNNHGLISETPGQISETECTEELEHDLDDDLEEDTDLLEDSDEDGGLGF
ncbi:Kinesin-like protein KIF23 [Gracilariopsis chorda]|uniref:Kinesin-like protein n=1 Tax=Gracilariopsis chorda TaxID=448386 RepID=A0A2V3IHD7_9FLOR|nr:Kinesin-like protein KIF23 [Gracilariopsis chorda]|eukprot:PXF41448.1 Kinesin-like protein KIF23 [Gracilariopsis chorda]